MNLADAENKIGYVFSDKSILERALTLSSADSVNNNQRLEFFGDAILEFIVSEIIYDEAQSEGTLTERRQTLVSDRHLRSVSEKLGLDKFLKRGKSDNSNKKAVPSVYEAVTAAIYLDGGLDAARNFIKTTLDFSENSLQNSKGELQEYLQGRGESYPEYITRNCGTPQAPYFTAEIEVDGETFSGSADNKREAEQNAARAALNRINGRG